MTTIATDIEYPETDGKPMAESTLQYEWIVTINTGVRELYAHRPDVFVGSDLFWYPVLGDDHTRMAPDVMVAFGRPPGHRRSYQQWDEANIPPHVVFEILSPANRRQEMKEKLAFYDRYGVEEYYLYDPNKLTLEGHLRKRGKLTPVRRMNGHVSPRLGIRFEMGGEGLRIVGPDGVPFADFVERYHRKLAMQQQIEQERQRAEEEKQRAEEEKQRAEQEKQRAEEEKQRAEEAARREAAARRDAELERQENQRLRDLLRSLGQDDE